MDQAAIEQAQRTLGGLFQGKSVEDQKQLLAALERAGAAIYRALAAGETDASARDGLLAAAGREEQNADFLDASLAS
jgi:hypothetical protein